MNKLIEKWLRADFARNPGGETRTPEDRRAPRRKEAAPRRTEAAPRRTAEIPDDSATQICRGL